MPPGAIPALTRPAPREWGGLVAFAEQAMDGLSEPDAAAAAAVASKCEVLDNETLDSLRYQGIGMIACELAKLLVRSDIHKGVVDRSGSALAEVGRQIAANSSDEAQLSGLPLAALRNANAADEPLIELSEQAAVHVARPILLLTDVLTVEASMRLIARDVAMRAGLPYEEAILSVRSVRHDAREMIIAGQLTARQVGGMALTAAMQIISTFLDKRYQSQPQHCPHPGKTDPCVNDVISDEELSGFRIGDQGNDEMRLSRVRQDVFAEDLSELVEVGADGQPTLNRDHVPDVKGGIPQGVSASQMILHERILGCPASYVTWKAHSYPELPHGMIRLVTERLIPEIIIAAQQKLIAT